MKQTESIEIRREMVDMHDYFKKKIDEAIERHEYIAASWLIYSCLENRYFRMLQKYRADCKYCRPKSKCNKGVKNTLAISTKIKCVERLYKQNVICISENFRIELFSETRQWIKDRNNLMHDLLTLECYENSDMKFKECAESGIAILNETYDSVGKFRKMFFDEKYQFVFPEEAMEGCPCKLKPKEKENG